MTALADMPAEFSAAAASPYVGLDAYSEQDAAIFFGRDAERRVLISNLRAARLTVLYAESGTGKSSLLRAGVAARLRELARQDLEETGTARNIPVVFSSWRDEPTDELIAEVRARVTGLLGAHALPDAEPGQRLADSLDAISRHVDTTLLIILDQFEEYFLYQSREAREGRFAEELAECINRPDLRAKFILAVREDVYAGLGDLFSGRIPNVYGNFLHLEYLDRDAAEAAVRKPLDYWNAHHPDDAMDIEPGLVEAVLAQVRTGEVVFEQEGKGALVSHNGSDGDRHVETPYLQLVMSTLWDREQLAGSHILRLSTLEQLGGAQRIVRSHLDAALGDLPRDQRETAIDVFHHLVTPSGTKIVMTVPDLAAYAGRSTEEVEALINTLTGGHQRIIRPVPPPREDGPARVEIFHDVLAPAILAWRSTQEAARLERERQAAQEAADRERRRARTFRGLAVVSLALAIIAGVAVLLATAATRRAHRAQHAATSRQLAAQASADLANGTIPQGALLSIEAFRAAPTSDARTSLIDALESTRGVVGYLPSHAGAVTSVAFSPDGREVASAGNDGRIIVAASGSSRVLARLHGQPGQTTSVAFSPDGRSLASGSSDGTVYLWSLATASPRQTLPGNGSPVETVAFSPDGSRLASAADDGRVTLWDPGSGRPLRTLRTGPRPIYDVTFSPRGGLLATAATDGSATLWKVAGGTRERTLRAQAGGINGVAFSPSGSELITGADDGTVDVWSVAGGGPIRTLRSSGKAIEGVAFSPDGHTVAAAAGDGNAVLWNAATGRKVSVLPEQVGAAVDTVAFSPSGSVLAAGSADGSVVLWNARPALGITALGLSGGDVAGLAFNRDGSLLASADSTGRIGLWNAATGSLVHAWRGHDQSADSVAFAPDGRTLASAGADGTVRLWSVPAGSPLRVFHDPAQDVYAVAFGGRLIASGDANGHVLLRDVATGRVVRDLGAGTGAVNSVAFSPDARTLVTGAGDGSVVIWDVSSGQAIRTLLGPTQSVKSVAFSPDGRTVAAASFDETITLWNARTGQRRGDELAGHQDSVNAVAFAPGAASIASGSTDGSVLLWNQSSRLAQPLGPNLGVVASVAFSPTGRALAWGGQNGMLLLDRSLPPAATPAAAETQLCRIVRRNLTRAEWRQFLANQPYRETCPS